MCTTNYRYGDFGSHRVLKMECIELSQAGVTIYSTNWWRNPIAEESCVPEYKAV
jgi:hypothetical protein